MLEQKALLEIKKSSICRYLLSLPAGCRENNKRNPVFANLHARRGCQVKKLYKKLEKVVDKPNVSLYNIKGMYGRDENAD